MCSSKFYLSRHYLDVSGQFHATAVLSFWKSPGFLWVGNCAHFKAGLHCEEEKVFGIADLFGAMKNAVSWDVMPCGSYKNRRFALMIEVLSSSETSVLTKAT
jgi:hypothetical protein